MSPKSPSTPISRRHKSRSKSPANATAYFTADDESLELLGNDMKTLKIGSTPPTVKKSAKKTPTKPASSSEDDEMILTPTTVDDGEMRKIRRLREGELKGELKKFGISPAGPLDQRTRRLYEKKLLIERRKIASRGYSPDLDASTFVSFFNFLSFLVFLTCRLERHFLELLILLCISPEPCFFSEILASTGTRPQQWLLARRIRLESPQVR